MDSQPYASAQELEIQRLQALLPEALRSQVAIESLVETSGLVTTRRTGKQRLAVQIDFAQWQQFSLEQRNLLWWHEVARIQGQRTQSASWLPIVMGIGAVSLLVELLSQNLLGVVTTLAVTGLGGYQLYQQHRGERFLRAAAAADQGAIWLAVQFGDSPSHAHNSLYSALKTLARSKVHKSRWKQYQVRLRVLEIVAPEQHLLSSQAEPSFTADLPYQVSSLCS